MGSKKNKKNKIQNKEISPNTVRISEIENAISVNRGLQVKYQQDADTLAKRIIFQEGCLSEAKRKK